MGVPLNSRMVRLFPMPRINVGHGSLGNPKPKDREPTLLENRLNFGWGRLERQC
jgi:hypothetical protein